VPCVAGVRHRRGSPEQPVRALRAWLATALLGVGKGYWMSTRTSMLPPSLGVPSRGGKGGCARGRRGCARSNVSLRSEPLPAVGSTGTDPTSCKHRSPPSSSSSPCPLCTAEVYLKGLTPARPDRFSSHPTRSWALPLTHSDLQGLGAEAMQEHE